jgi:hypothetical protein
MAYASRGMTTTLDCDALAVLVVRLASDQPATGEFHWRRWDEIHDSGKHGIDPDSRAEDASPHKQLPVPERQPYFTAHVQRLLYPPREVPGLSGACAARASYRSTLDGANTTCGTRGSISSSA